MELGCEIFLVYNVCYTQKDRDQWEQAIKAVAQSSSFSNHTNKMRPPRQDCKESMHNVQCRAFIANAKTICALRVTRRVYGCVQRK